MAKISSPWVGISKGKLGEGVYYHANGRQLARARNRQPANPRTDKQAVQRMVLASAAKALASLRSLYDHSAESVQVGQQSIFYWQRILTQGFRAAAAAEISEATSIPAAEFAIKGAPTIAVYTDMPLSEGRLSMRPIQSLNAGVMKVSISADLSDNFSTQAAYEAELAKLGIQPGDQLTFVYIAYNYAQPVAQFNRAVNNAAIARYARVTFVSKIPEGFNGALLAQSGANGVFNPALVARAEGSWPDTAVEENTLVLEPILPDGFTMVAATIVRSQMQTNGKTWYNSAKFVANADSFEQNDATLVYPSYMDNAEGIEVGSPLYLKNAIVSPN